MRLRTRSLVSLAVAALAVAPAAAATGLMDTGDDLVPHDDARAVVHGALRVRGEALGNLDLDRGPLENGVPLFPVTSPAKP